MTFLNSDYFENKFQDLLDHLDSQDLSVLIGAGFSKNVNQILFPSWWELLEKMVLKMFEKQYKYDFKEKEGRPWHAAKLKYNNYIKGRIEQYIEKEGYLNTVSNYISQMGFRETVELYIEEHTPVATVDDGQNVLLTYENGERTKKTILAEADLSIHKSLLRLPWSNVFTTNYDNLLEFCSNLGDDIVEKLLREYQQQIDSNKKLIQEKENLVEKLSKKIDEKEIIITNHFLSKKTGGQNTSTKEYKKEETEPTTTGTHQEETLEDLQSQKLVIEKEIELIEKEQKKISSKITDLRSNTYDNYSRIIHSSQLEIKRSKNIIKLHGTIRELRNDPFSFNNDYSKCYVISKEDYDSYPVKHEAFTQLMRISLLQGYFCLIGFSGDDPNFIAWISWIRDIVNRKTHKENSSNKVAEIKDKIYFIDVTANKSADTHRQQFYNNHKIVHIPLAHPNSISTLNNHFDKTIDPENPKEILSYFLKYLKGGAVINQQQAEVEVKLREYYENFFRSLPYIGEEISEEKLKQICQDFSKIKTLKPYSRISSIEFSIDISRRNFIANVDNYLKISLKSKELQKNILFIMVQIIWDTYARPSSLVENFQKYIDLSKTLCLHLYNEFLLLDMFDAVWLADANKVNDLYKTLTGVENSDYTQMANFLAALHKKLTFNTKDLNDILQKWQPHGHWTILKATFILKSNEPNSLNLLKKHQFPNFQEELYILQLQRLLSFEDLKSPQKNDRINNLRSAKFRSIYENFDYLEESFKDKIEPIKPLGEGRNTVSRSINFSNTSEDLQSLQFFGLLMMSGFPLKHGIINFKKPQNIFPAIRKALKFAPIPVLYYALQYTEKKFIQRIGQEYIAQPEIDEDGMMILNSMENAYFQNGQTHSQNSITIFLSEYINVIDQNIWTSLFEKIWLDKKNNNALFEHDHRNDTTFIEKSIALLTDAETMVFIINDCLEAILNNDSNIHSPSINYLYRLTQNPYYSQNGNIIKEGISITLLEKLLNQLYEEPDRLFIVGYVMDFLPVEIRKNIKEIIDSWNLGNISNERIWTVISYFIKQDSVLQRKVINAIINSDNLWNTGIKGNTISSGNYYIPLRQLRKSPNSDYGLKLKKSEASQIFNKLNLTLSEIEKKSGQGIGIFDFKFILQEMIWFLEDEKNLLKDQQDYNNVLIKAKSIFEGEKGGLDLFNGLLSNTVEDINWAIMEISRQLYDLNRFKEHKKHLEIILNRILCKNPIGLELCLNYMANWFYNFKDRESLKTYEIEAIEILKVYYDNYPDNCDSAYIEGLLIRIAYVLRYWKIDDRIIGKYFNLLEESRFNSIKYILKLNLNSDK